jgi:hypothetical protein
VLFDLRSPRRRRAVQVVFGSLAALFAISFVGFGIGSGGLNGGLFDALGLTDSSGGSATTGFDSDIEDAQAKVEQNPRDQQALLDLVTLNLQKGNSELDIDQTTGQPSVNSDSEEAFNDAADAWDRYLKLKPVKPESGAALQMAGAFFLLAQGATSATDAQIQVANAADAQKIAAEQNPSTGNLNQLALYLYFAGRFAQGDSAAARAVATAPAPQRNQLRSQFEQLKKQAQQLQQAVKQEAQGASQGGNPLEQGGGALSGG